MVKIYLFAQPGAFGHDSGYRANALCEDGDFLAGHVSSSIDWAKADMGLTGTRKHDLYAEHCPDGYELEWVDDLENHAGLNAAYELHLTRYAGKAKEAQQP